MGVIKRILFAEDDAKHAAATRALLEAAGWTVEWASDGKKAWTLYERRKPDLLLVDWELPKTDGAALIRQVRERDRRTPIVVYSGKVSDEDLKMFFELRADEVVRKGASAVELLSRVEHQYERVWQRPGGAHVYALGAGVAFNSESGSLKADGREIRLPWREAALLGLLCENANRVVRDEMLLERLWAKEGKGNMAQLRKCVSALKKSTGGEDGLGIEREGNGYVLRVKDAE